MPGPQANVGCSLGIYYPRGSTVGGSVQVNAMNIALPPEKDWAYIAELTGDESWAPEAIRQHWIDLERSVFFPPGTPGHGFDGYVSVRLIVSSPWDAAANACRLRLILTTCPT